MTSIRSARATVVSLVVALASIAPSARGQSLISYDQFSAWIARYHLNVIAGDRRVNAVLIVVDTNRQYVASVADSLPLEVTAAIDSMFASVGARNAVEGAARELVAGRLTVPGAEGPPVYIVDGVRVSRVDSLSVNSIEGIRVVNAADAAKYGAGAEKGGAIVVTTSHSEHQSQVMKANLLRRLNSLGIRADRVDIGDEQMMHVRGGAIGPNPLYITILHLK
jgi:hypothetical protein